MDISKVGWFQLNSIANSLVSGNSPSFTDVAGDFGAPWGGANHDLFVAQKLDASAEETAQVESVLASQARREDEWKLQAKVAQQDIGIGKIQEKIAVDQIQIANQEQYISQVQAIHAKAIVEFLGTKFTGAPLYGWMGGILTDIYRFFLQQATSIAQLAQKQIAFERHDIAPSFIRSDYWQSPPTSGEVTGAAASDRKGLTGSERLLQDITELDQYAFLTDQRKQQITKVISLSQLAPTDFENFRQSGTLAFRTPMILFDLDFPGHYLRLIS